MSKPNWTIEVLSDDVTRWNWGAHSVYKNYRRTFCEVVMDGKLETCICCEDPAKAREAVERIVREREQREEEETDSPRLRVFMAGTETKCRDSMLKIFSPDCFVIRPATNHDLAYIRAETLLDLVKKGMGGEPEALELKAVLEEFYREIQELVYLG